MAHGAIGVVRDAAAPARVLEAASFAAEGKAGRAGKLRPGPRPSQARHPALLDSLQLSLADLAVSVVWGFGPLVGGSESQGAARPSNDERLLHRVRDTIVAPFDACCGQVAWVSCVAWCFFLDQIPNSISSALYLRGTSCFARHTENIVRA